MGLRGCISIDSLPLQILLNDNPGWRGIPVAVTGDERPQSPVLALNQEARDRGLERGMKYSSALSLVPTLRARSVPPDRVNEARESIVRTLTAFTPDIEPCSFDTGAFWVSVEGLLTLYDTEARWSQVVRGALEGQGFAAVVVIGFTRFGTYAIARTTARSCVTASREKERELLGRTPVSILPLSQRTKSTLHKLEIRTVRHFVALPEGETVRRFGKEAGALLKAILSDDPLPIQSVSISERVPCIRHLDTPLADLAMLMPHIEELLVMESRRADGGRSVISGLTLVLRTEDGEVSTDLVRPAVPTLDSALLGRLIALRLSSRQFASGVEDIEIRSARVPPSRTQEELFDTPSRDLKAGARAIAAIRARFGDDSVACARLRDSWLPECSFSWVPIKEPVLPRPRPVHQPADHPTAVRRIFFTPGQAAPGFQEHGGGRDPCILSGSWWGTGAADAAYHREYFFQDTEAGVAWFCRDKLAGATRVQGVVD